MTSSPPAPDPFTVVAAALCCTRESLSIESSMYSDYGWDSFGHAGVITAIEEACGIRVPNDEVMKYTKMKAIIELFEHHFGVRT
jgi:acyl carrier protein